MAVSMIPEQIPIKVASSTVSSRATTVTLEDGYTMSNTLIVGVEFRNSSGSVINVQGTTALSQCRWSAARNGIYFLFASDDYNDGTAVVYYMKVPRKHFTS